MRAHQVWPRPFNSFCSCTHERSLADIWGCEITAFAPELSTVTLATSDTHEPAAYPRVLPRDFFALRPGLETSLEIPGIPGRLCVPQTCGESVGANWGHLPARFRPMIDFNLYALEPTPRLHALRSIVRLRDALSLFPIRKKQSSVTA